MNTLVIIIVIVVAIAAIVITYAFPKIKGLHYVSKITCPKCHREFEYHWIPGGSFSAVRLGKYRYMSCPKCHKWSLFDVWTTRVKDSGMENR